MNSLSACPDFRVLQSMLSSFDLVHVSFQATRVDPSTRTVTAIDHVFLSSRIPVKDFATCPASYSDHDMLFVALDFPKPVSQPVCITYRDYAGVDRYSLRDAFVNIDWTSLFSSTDVNFKVNFLTERLQEIFQHHVPEKSFVLPDPSTPWLTPHLQEEKETAYSLWRSRRFRRKGDSLWLSYISLSKKVISVTRASKSKYFGRKFDSRLPSRILFRNFRNEGVIDTDRNCSPNLNFDLNELNKHFIGNSPIPSQEEISPTTSSVRDLEFNFTGVTELEIFESFMSIESNAIGMDGLERKFISLIIHDLLPILCDIYNRVIMTSNYPVLWKSAIVYPLPKKNDPKQLSDFRLISIVCYLSKILEKLLLKQIQLFVNSNQMIHPMQSAFRKGHSTEKSLINLVSDICNSSGYKDCTILASIDLSKAYDSVPHRGLVQKLANKYLFSRHTLGDFRFLSG